MKNQRHDGGDCKDQELSESIPSNIVKNDLGVGRLKVIAHRAIDTKRIEVDDARNWLTFDPCPITQL